MKQSKAGSIPRQMSFCSFRGIETDICMQKAKIMFLLLHKTDFKMTHPKLACFVKVNDVTSDNTVGKHLQDTTTGLSSLTNVQKM